MYVAQHASHLKTSFRSVFVAHVLLLQHMIVPSIHSNQRTFSGTLTPKFHSQSTQPCMALFLPSIGVCSDLHQYKF